MENVRRLVVEVKNGQRVIHLYNYIRLVFLGWVYVFGGCLWRSECFALEFRLSVYEGAKFLRLEDVYFLGRLIMCVWNESPHQDRF